MYARFFLTLPYYLDSTRKRGYSLGSTNVSIPSHASTHIPKKEPYELLTFNNAMEKIGRECSNSNSTTGDDAALIFIDDVVSFQLETVALVNNSFCTYNTETKLIGFGSDVYKAKLAADDPLTGQRGAFVFTTPPTSGKMFDFYLPNSINEFDSYQYTVPDAFYDSVLNELIPYIDFIKLEKFRRVTSEIIKNSSHVDNYIDNYHDNTATIPNMNFNIMEFILAVRMFLDDDPVLLANKCYMENNYTCMSVLIRSVQRLTNETF